MPEASFTPWNNLARQAFKLLEIQQRHHDRLVLSGTLYKCIEANGNFSNRYETQAHLWRAFAYRVTQSVPIVATPARTHNLGVRIRSIRDAGELNNPTLYNIPVGKMIKKSDGELVAEPNRPDVTYTFDEEDVRVVYDLTEELERLRVNGSLTDIASDLTYIRNFPLGGQIPKT